MTARVARKREIRVKRLWYTVNLAQAGQPGFGVAGIPEEDST